MTYRRWVGLTVGSHGRHGQCRWRHSIAAMFSVFSSASLSFLQIKKRTITFYSSPPCQNQEPILHSTSTAVNDRSIHFTQIIRGWTKEHTRARFPFIIFHFDWSAQTVLPFNGSTKRFTLGTCLRVNESKFEQVFNLYRRANRAREGATIEQRAGKWHVLMTVNCISPMRWFAGWGLLDLFFSGCINTHSQVGCRELTRGDNGRTSPRAEWKMSLSSMVQCIGTVVGDFFKCGCCGHLPQVFTCYGTSWSFNV